MRLIVGLAVATAVLFGCGGGNAPASDSGAEAVEVLPALPVEPAGPTAAEDIAAIRALQVSWNAAVENADVAGYVAVLDPEVELLPTDAPPINGPEGYAAMLEGVFSTNTFEIDVVAPSIIEVAGDWAYARYDYVIHRMPKDSDERFSTERKFLDILRRQADGSWRVYRHIWNYNTPDATP